MTKKILLKLKIEAIASDLSINNAIFRRQPQYDSAKIVFGRNSIAIAERSSRREDFLTFLLLRWPLLLK